MQRKIKSSSFRRDRVGLHSKGLGTYRGFCLYKTTHKDTK